MCLQGPNPHSMDGKCLLEAYQAHTPPHMVGFKPNHLRGGKCQTLTFTPRHSFVLTMLQKYANTRKHRASLPNPQEPPGMWPLAARALALVQLGVGLVLCYCVWGSQGGVHHDTPL